MKRMMTSFHQNMMTPSTTSPLLILHETSITIPMHMTQMTTLPFLIMMRTLSHPIPPPSSRMSTGTVYPSLRAVPPILPPIALVYPIANTHLSYELTPRSPPYPFIFSIPMAHELQPRQQPLRVTLLLPLVGCFSRPSGMVNGQVQRPLYECSLGIGRLLKGVLIQSLLLSIWRAVLQVGGKRLTLSWLLGKLPCLYNDRAFLCLSGLRGALL